MGLPGKCTTEDVKVLVLDEVRHWICRPINEIEKFVQRN